MHRTLVQRLAPVLLVAAILGGCASSAEPAPSTDQRGKAGGHAGPIAITVADSQFQGRPSNLPLDELKRQIESQSAGAMKVEILYEASADADPPYSDGPVVDKVRSGDFQMAVVPARAWSAKDVTSMRALQAPFLFQSDGHVAAALRDRLITRDLLSGLEGTGVTGLTLFPESLRHLFSYREPLLTPADVRGKTFQAIASLETTAIIEALGGQAVYLSDAEWEQGIAAGTIDGTDSGLSISVRSPLNWESTATGNASIYAKVVSLVVNTSFWNGLSEEQRAIIASAADATREWAIENQTTDAEAATAFCEAGGRVVVADRQELEAFREAVQPVYAKLEEDPLTKRAIAAIAALPGQGDAESVAPCEPDAPVLEPEGGALPDGVYRIEATEAFLKADYPDFYPNAEGVYTFTLDDGRWAFDYVSPNGESDHQSGTYRVSGDDVQWLWDPCCAYPNPVIDATWSVDAEGTLHFVQLSGPPGWAMALPFVRVGDLP